MFEPRRLPRAVAALGRRGAHRRDHGAAAEVDRGKPTLGRRPSPRRRGRGRRARLHGAAPAPVPRARAARAGPDRRPRRGLRRRGRRRWPTSIMSDEFRAGLYAFDLVQKRAKRPAGAPDKALARPVTKVGVIGAGLMASQLALLFVAPAAGAGGASPTSTRRASTRASATSTARSTSCSAKGRINARHGQPAQGAGHRLDRQGRVRRRRLRHRGRLRGARRSSSRSSPRSRRSSPPSASSPPTPRRCRSPRWPRELQHPERVVGFHFFNPVAVMPLLEIVRGRDDRRRDARHGLRRRQAAEARPRAGQGRPGVRRQPAAHPLPRRGDSPPSTRARRSRSPTARWTRSACRCRPFVLLQLVGPRSALHVPETLHDGLPGPVRGLGEPAPRLVAAGKHRRLRPGTPTGSRPSTHGGRRRCSSRATTPLTHRGAGPRPRAGRARRGDPAHARRGRRRRGRRTSTCA